jgi:hypothetical protein
MMVKMSWNEISNDPNDSHGSESRNDTPMGHQTPHLRQIVCDRLQDGLEHGEREYDVNETAGVEEGRDEHATQRRHQIADTVQERTVRYHHAHPQPYRVAISSEMDCSEGYYNALLSPIEIFVLFKKL